MDKHMTQYGSATDVVCNTSGKTKLKDYGITKKDLEIENFDLIAKVNELLNEHELYEPDGTYTFKDGERWARLDMGEDDNESNT